MVKGAKYCLVTVTTENYVQWTMTMLYSFLKTNSWFEGDIIIVGCELSEKTISRLGIFPNVIIEAPSALLQDKLKQLVTDIPSQSVVESVFYSLEVFRFSGYDKILFLDSDIIVVKNLEELFTLPGHFYACDEWYSGKGRALSDYVQVDRATPGDDFISHPVNSGFMLVSGEMLIPGMYEKLVEFLHPDHWRNCSRRFGDEVIINKFFNRRITLLDARYNYRPKIAEGIFNSGNIKFEDAKIIHFLLKAKPWNFDQVYRASIGKMEMLQAFECWYSWYFDFLSWFHLMKKIEFAKNR
jgi:lipopolysaccharide biosynthesis glycosyltransferase